MTRPAFHFVSGNNWDGPVAVAATVAADTPEEALRKLRAALPEEIQVDPANGDPDVLSIFVRVNPAAVRQEDVDNLEDLAEDFPALDPGTTRPEGPT